MHQGKKPASLDSSTAVSRDTLCHDIGGISGEGYLIVSFTLQLRGPFLQILRAGFHPSLLSGTFFFGVLVLINVTI